MLVEGDVGVPDAGFEGDLGGLERVVGWEGEEELELTALGGLLDSGFAWKSRVWVGRGEKVLVQRKVNPLGHPK